MTENEKGVVEVISPIYRLTWAEEPGSDHPNKLTKEEWLKYVEVVTRCIARGDSTDRILTKWIQKELYCVGLTQEYGPLGEKYKALSKVYVDSIPDGIEVSDKYRMPGLDDPTRPLFRELMQYIIRSEKITKSILENVRTVVDSDTGITMYIDDGLEEKQ